MLTLDNNLSPNEKLSIIRKSWAVDYLASLKKCQKRSIQTMSSLKPREWQRHKNRKIAICLHWLRAGHHYLNSFAQRINQENDPSCRLGCQAIENSQHVLLACPVNEHYHLEFRLFLAGKNLEANLDNLLGLNTSVSIQTQIRIRDLLAKFLAKTSLTD